MDKPDDHKSSIDSDWAIEPALLAIASMAWREHEPGRDTETEAAYIRGRFEGLPPHVEFLDDGRKIRLLRPLSFVHPNYAPWPVPAGTVADGASIPRPFWSLIGGPFEGRYRNASIVHDLYCDIRTRPWRDVHRMFFEAMLAGGVAPFKAKILYYAVYRFGPRWNLATELTELAPSQSATPDGAAMHQAALDAEAISRHGLSLDEIDAMADAREARLELEGVAAAAGLTRARDVVIPGGTGSIEDVEAVASQAALLPSFVIERFEATGIRIIACRGSVTDFEQRLRGVVPRGWNETGKTWDDVPGAYFPDRKRVIVATVGIPGGRAVPTKASRSHGSIDLVVHESFHGYDYVGGHSVLQDPEYCAARTADLHNLGPYERQEGQAGLEETFAESGARFVADPAMMAGAWPNLFHFWDQIFQGSAIVEGIQLESVQANDAPIGTADVLEDGTIEIDLRAEGPGGAIGHGWLTLSRDDPDHAARIAWISRSVGVEEAAGGGPFLVKP